MREGAYPPPSGQFAGAAQAPFERLGDGGLHDAVVTGVTGLDHPSELVEQREGGAVGRGNAEGYRKRGIYRERRVNGVQQAADALSRQGGDSDRAAGLTGTGGRKAAHERLGCRSRTGHFFQNQDAPGGGGG